MEFPEFGTCPGENVAMQDLTLPHHSQKCGNARPDPNNAEENQRVLWGPGPVLPVLMKMRQCKT